MQISIKKATLEKNPGWLSLQLGTCRSHSENTKTGRLLDAYFVRTAV